MNRTTSRRTASVTVSLLAVLGLGLAACGGDDDDDASGTTTVDVTTSPDGSAATSGTAGDDPADMSEDEYVTALAGGIGVGDDVSACVAQAAVDAVGFDNIQEAGVTPQEFAAASTLDELDLTIDDAGAEQLRSDVGACDGLVDAILEGAGLDEEQSACAQGVLTPEIAAELITGELTSTPPSAEFEAASAELEACATSTTATTTG